MTGMDRNDGAWKYSDILYVRHPEPSRARMSREKRAAQFAPFAALTGYEEAVRETARAVSYTHLTLPTICSV